LGRFFISLNRVAVIKPNFLLRSVARWLVVGIVLPCLTACGLQNPTFDTLLNVLPGGRDVSAGLNAGFTYLRVDLDSRSSVMALGSRRVVGEAPFEDVVEYWYNGQGEMLVLRNGRIHQVIGMAQEWRNNQSKPPRWNEVAATNFPNVWLRQLDRMPGYRFDATDQISTYRVEQPKNLPADVPAGAQWFADDVQSETRQAKPWRFTQRFAVLDQSVVYSEQCVSETICLKLRPLAKVDK
jgi:hypothetical protein